MSRTTRDDLRCFHHSKYECFITFFHSQFWACTRQAAARRPQADCKTAAVAAAAAEEEEEQRRIAVAWEEEEEHKKLPDREARHSSDSRAERILDAQEDDSRPEEAHS